MPNKRIKVFFLYIVDHDNKMFNIIGPMSDDSAWTKRVVEIQDTGREVSCFSNFNIDDKERSAKEYSIQTGFTFNQDMVL